MLSTWLFIALFGASGAQVIETQNAQACIELKTFANNEINKNPDLKGKIVTGCFKNIGKRNIET